jgi:hypothetical protein
MKTIKDLTCEVTYTVGLGNLKNLKTKNEKWKQKL